MNSPQSKEASNWKSYKAVLLALVGLGTTMLVIVQRADPMLMMIPLWIFTVLFKEPLRKFFGRFGGGWGFYLAGVVYGLMIETMAVLNNLSVPPQDRILLHPDPWIDLIYGLFYYGFVIAAWTLLLRKIEYTPAQVFILTGVYGIFVEETGQVFLRIFTQPLTGFLYALLVMVVYGLFPMLALSVSGSTFTDDRPPARMKGWGLALLALFFQYAVYGNTIYPLLNSWFR